MRVVEKASAEVLQAKIEKYEKVRVELTKLLQAKANTMRSLEEAKAVLSELDKLPDESQLYKLVGFVLVPVSKPNLKEELDKKIKDLEATIKKLEAMEKSLAEELERLAREIQSLSRGAMGGAGLGGVGG